VAARIGRQPHELLLKRQGQRPFKDMLTLAEHILDSKASEFDPATFRDRYEEALLAHLKASVVDQIAIDQPGYSSLAALTA